MDISNIKSGVSDVFSVHYFVGKIVWACLVMLWTYTWKIVKGMPEGTMKQIRSGGMTIIGVVGLLTMISQLGALPNSAEQPDFKMMIMNPSLSDSNPRTHTFAVDAKIWNAGGPSVVVGWSLKIKGPDKKSFNFPEMVLTGSNAIFTALSNDGAKQIFRPSDSMEGKAGEIPIERGGERSGFVLFQITDTARDYLLSLDATYEISCMDTAGKWYSLSFNWPTPSK